MNFIQTANWYQLRRTLTSPKPGCGSPRQFAGKTIFMAVVVPVFLLLYNRLNPFTATDFSWLVLVGVGPLMALLVMLNHFGIRPIIEKVASFKIELVWQSILWRIWSISFVLTGVLFFLSRFEFVRLDIYRAILITGFIILVSLFSIIRFNSLQLRLLARYQNGQASLSKKLAAQKLNGNGEAVTIASENLNEVLQLSLNELLFIRSDQNYVTVVFRQNGKVQNELFRNSLSRLEKELKNGSVVRCHRSYIVNLRQAIKVSGNAQGMSIILRGQDEALPVSRKYMQSVRHAILNLN